MRAILVGVVAAAVAVAGPAFAGGNVEDWEATAPRANEAALPASQAVPQQNPVPFHETPPFADIVGEETHSAGQELGMGIGATLFSLLYTPIRLVVGAVGAGLGGFGGWSTGGDMRTAQAFWRPMVEGNYYIRPSQFDGDEQFRFSNVDPVVRERRTAWGTEPIPVHEVEAQAAPGGETAGYAPAPDADLERPPGADGGLEDAPL